MGEHPFGVSQGSILVPLLFNICTSNLFSIMNNLNFASYTDDNTPNVISDGVKQALNL